MKKKNVFFLKPTYPNTTRCVQNLNNTEEHMYSEKKTTFN